VVIVYGQGQLVEVVGALDAGRCLADLLDRGDQQADEDGDDGDDDQQFDERKPGPATDHV
jgi:hypothetical protein